ncbi:hypothetical protein F2Q69_00006037 [Brassica cretica]|uniref:Uncharacterized protein n=1 Tax=Brassica cretica TaxID=69181 RepID=A0A8S9P8G6_BRACR|nr:hypothetical protein F2Q69_00006037 [Brassica cretica]
MLSLPYGLEYQDVPVRAGGVCVPAHRQQQDRPASAEAPPATRPPMRTSPHISIPIYLFRHMDTLQLAQTFSVSALLIDNETVTSIDNEAVTSIDRDAMISIDYAVNMSIDIRDRV